MSTDTAQQSAASSREGSESPEDWTPSTWTGGIRKWLQRKLPYDKLLPETQPAYVASWIYVFGVLTLVALGILIVTGFVLSFEGPSWYHVSGVGLFFNSLHFWACQLFFLFMVIHLWGKFWMAAWRGKRAKTWITGVLASFVSIGAGLTGYLLQTNFDSQWISFQSKDGLNSVGMGAWFDVANLGQMMLVHVFFLPVIIAVFVVVHVVLVRIHGVVPPIDAAKVLEAQEQPQPEGAR